MMQRRAYGNGGRPRPPGASNISAERDNYLFLPISLCDCLEPLHGSGLQIILVCGRHRRVHRRIVAPKPFPTALVLFAGLAFHEGFVVVII